MEVTANGQLSAIDQLFPGKMTVTGQTKCKKCGDCCREGGPALHKKDLYLVRDGIIPINSLITIRKGELTHNPVTETIQPVGVELIKITGKGQQWECCYYDEQKGCTIYDNRPQACVLLKCWDTKDILDLLEKETLSRFDILAFDDPLIPLIKEYEYIFPCPDFLYIRDRAGRLSVQQKKELEKQVGDDLRFRTGVIEDFKLQLSEELFYFGRPLFQQLQSLGAIITETQSEIILRWKT